MLSEAERLACLRLIRSEHVGPVTYRHLLGRFGTAESALAGLPALARKGRSLTQSESWSRSPCLVAAW